MSIVSIFDDIYHLITKPHSSLVLIYHCIIYRHNIITATNCIIYRHNIITPTNFSPLLKPNQRKHFWPSDNSNLITANILDIPTTGLICGRMLWQRIAMPHDHKKRNMIWRAYVMMRGWFWRYAKYLKSVRLQMRGFFSLVHNKNSKKVFVWNIMICKHIWVKYFFFTLTEFYYLIFFYITKTSKEALIWNTNNTKYDECKTYQFHYYIVIDEYYNPMWCKIKILSDL